MKQIWIIVLLALTGLSSCDYGPEKAETVSEELIRVGVFNGNGASAVCVLETMEALKIDEGIDPKEISASEIMQGGLDELDVLIFPGGSGSKEFNNLGLRAAEKVKVFAKQKNKGLVGICAGAYLLASTPNYPGLNILPVHSIREYYDRGRGLISFSTNALGNEIFPELITMKESFVQYYDGPMYVDIDSSKFTILATVNSDISAKKGYPKGVSVGKPALGVAIYGEGKVFMIIGHPEATSGMRWMVPRMARWIANRELISYNKEVVSPEKYTHELLYTTETIKFEKENFWKLSSTSDMEINTALDNLHSIYSRPSIRWSIGLLRHTSPNVRIAAAKYLQETEYTFAIPDMKTAVKNEIDPETKKKMGNILIRLEQIIH